MLFIEGSVYDDLNQHNWAKMSTCLPIKQCRVLHSFLHTRSMLEYLAVNSEQKKAAFFDTLLSVCCWRHFLCRHFRLSRWKRNSCKPRLVSESSLPRSDPRVRVRDLRDFRRDLGRVLRLLVELKWKFKMLNFFYVMASGGLYSTIYITIYSTY